MHIKLFVIAMPVNMKAIGVTSFFDRTALKQQEQCQEAKKIFQLEEI